MALGILKIILLILIIAAVIIQFLLYRNKVGSVNSVFIVNMLLGILLSFLAFTALPTNFTGQRVLAITWGVIAVLAVVLKFTNEKLIMVSKVLLSIAIIGSLVQLFY